MGAFFLSLFFLFSPAEKNDEFFFQRIQQDLVLIEEGLASSSNCQIDVETFREEIKEILSSYFFTKRSVKDEEAMAIFQNLFRNLQKINQKELKDSISIFRSNVTSLKIYLLQKPYRRVNQQNDASPSCESREVKRPRSWKKPRCHKNGPQNLRGLD